MARNLYLLCVLVFASWSHPTAAAARIAPIDLHRVDEALSSAVTLQLPSPTGSILTFEVVETTTMDPGLRSKYPSLRTFAGSAVGNPSIRLRLERSNHGIRARVYAAESSFEILPELRGKHVFHTAADEATNAAACMADDSVMETRTVSKPNGAASRSVGETRSTYRLAMSATLPFVLSVGGTSADALAAFATIVNRLNEILEREANVSFVLIANTDLLISSSAGDFTSGNTSLLIDENQIWTDSIVGTAAYDVGHLLDSVGPGVGTGLAFVGGPCSPTIKAKSVSVVPSATDFWIVNVVAHQVTHVLGGRHTFNGAGSFCATSWDAVSAYSPGSGSTIQALPGSCGADNLQSSRDDYLHFATFDQIQAETVGCAGSTPTGNAAPVASEGPSGFVIPGSTPFRLCGMGTDPDGDPLTYKWEQSDLGGSPTPLTSGDTGLGPLFRSYAPSSNPCRTFPRDAFVGQGNLGEILPTTNRSLSFRLTAQDGLGGIDVSDPVALTVSTSATFSVFQPTSGQAWYAGETQNVQWVFTGTDLPPVNCATVSIHLSDNSGMSYDIELLAATGNDGSANIVVPALSDLTPDARIAVFCNDNVFFNVTNSFDIAGSECVDSDNDGYRTGPPTDCPGSITLDCDDSAAQVFPGAPEICDGVLNDCDAPGWPALTGTDEMDDDGDGFSECQNDCDDANPGRYSDAPEINDGLDNQCPGDLGFGLVDEITGATGFFNPVDNTDFSWPAQALATSYEVARSTSPDFSTDCVNFVVSVPFVLDPVAPPLPGDVLYYLVRPNAPFPGSWGQGTTGERTAVCESEMPRVIFITSASLPNGDLGGLAGADAACQNLADNAGLGGTYKAWLSDSNNDVKDRMTQSPGPYQLVNGTQVASSFADLIDCPFPYTGCSLDNLIDVDENGNATGLSFVYTGTFADGTEDGGFTNCNDWTTTASSARSGRSDRIDSQWTACCSTTCNTPSRLYCVEQ